ncbi:hypothetical protein C1645_829183 [Glomus cerebriforme]|uniref:Uncharacterized protein n=1 Tax=Glomus cerebriforme TaxID=658196 RepID=A0A397SLG6_9GLOM|nr:hypothetical protein C1645_829183 [Glomus cerebriforme]
MEIIGSAKSSNEAIRCSYIEDILENDEELHRGVSVKKVMEVIVGLLKDRVEVDDAPDNKRARMKKFIKELVCGS